MKSAPEIVMQQRRFAECSDPRALLDLTGRKGLVIGIANERSLTWLAALHFRPAGAELAITYVGDRSRPHMTPLAEWVEAPMASVFQPPRGGKLEANP